jgi:hypothetical protein
MPEMPAPGFHTSGIPSTVTAVGLKMLETCIPMAAGV